MTINEFEKELKKLDSNFYIKKSLNHHNIIFYKCVKRGIYDIDANKPFEDTFITK